MGPDRRGDPDGAAARPGSAGSQVLSPSGDRVAASTGTGVVVLDARDGRVVARPSGTVSAVYGWRDESHLVAGDAGGLVLLGLDGGTRPYASGGALPDGAALTRAGP